MTELPAQIRLALSHLAEDIEDSEISSRLQQIGFSLELAEKCVMFVPLAFGRLVLHSLKAETSDTYCLVSGSRTTCGLLLVNEPIYTAALQVGQGDVNNGDWSKNLHQLVALRSCEMHACNQMLIEDPATNVANIIFTAPCVILTNRLPKQASKSWWQFW